MHISINKDASAFPQTGIPRQIEQVGISTKRSPSALGVRPGAHDLTGVPLHVIRSLFAANRKIGPVVLVHGQFNMHDIGGHLKSLHPEWSLIGCERP